MYLVNQTHIVSDLNYEWNNSQKASEQWNILGLMDNNCNCIPRQLACHGNGMVQTTQTG